MNDNNNNFKKSSRTKAPAFLFYASDWLTDPSLRLCSAETRGVWIDLLCLMFLSSEPGFLTIGSQILDKKGIQKLSGISQKRFTKVFDELTNFGILKQDEKGRFYSKRMIEDEALRQMRRDFGKLGGNPKLKNKPVDLVQNKVNQNDKQKTTLSISNSISYSKEENNILNSGSLENQHELQKFVFDNCPDVQKLKIQLTASDCEKLIAAAGSRAAVEEVLLAMENFKDVSRKYKSVFLTCNTWIKRRKNEQQQQTSNRQGGKPSFDDTIRNF